MKTRVFGLWTIDSDEFEKAKTKTLVSAVCECGTQRGIRKSNLINGQSQSCGCTRWRHGFCVSHRRLVAIFRKIHDRCSNPKNPKYQNYGARGIKVCEQWNDFIAFGNWALSHGYDEALSIDRIDNEKGYFPENCRWADGNLQSTNRRGSNLERGLPTGVFATPYGTYRARVKRSGQTYRLGSFQSSEQASAAYQSKLAELRSG